MQGYKKSILSLAITGVLSGMMAVSAYAANVAITGDNDGGTIFVGGSNTVPNKTVISGDTISVAEGVDITSNSAGDAAALTVDTESTDLTLGITVTGTINGALANDNSTAADKDGLVIAGTRALIGHIIINGNITGGASGTGLNADAEITGEIAIGSGVTVTAGTAGTGVSIGEAQTGKLTNSGTIGGASTATGLSLGATVLEGVSNSGTIEGTAAAITVGADNTLTNEAAGKI